MFTIETYIKKSISFSKSLIIKFKDVAIAVNKGLEIQGVPTPKEERDWKYYLNISGRRHFTNKDVIIPVIETGKEEILSKELLDNNPYTRKELKKLDQYYTDLIERYPEEELFIKGCIFPVDIDQAIRAEDGTILDYDTSFVESNEYNLIRELETYIKLFISRWHNRSYTITDELYIASMLAVLYANLPSKVLASKIDKIQTNEVDSFNLENFFRSKLGIWNEISILKKETVFWLYNNLDYLMNNLGKQETMNLLVNKVFEENGIGIGEYILKQPDLEIDNSVRYDELPIIKKDTIALSKKLNDSYKIAENTEVSIEKIVELELNDTYGDTPPEIKTFITNDVINKVEERNLDNQKTKILDIAVGKLFKRYGFDLFRVIVDHWVYLAKKNQKGDIFTEYVYKEPTLDYVEPNDSKTYAITPKVGLLMLLKLMLKLTGNTEQRIKTLNYSYVLPKSEKVLEDALDKVYDDGYIGYYIDEMKKHIPIHKPYFSSKEEMGKFIHEVLDYYSYVWSMDANTESIATSFLIKQIFGYTIQSDSYTLTDNEDGLTIDQLLESVGVNYEVRDDFNIESSISALILTFTGIHVDEYYYVKLMLNYARSLIGKMSSYTIQTIADSNTEKSSPAFYNNLSAFKVRKGIITVRDGEFIPLEQYHTEIDSAALNFIDEATLIYVNSTDIVSAFCKKPIWGQAEVYTGPIVRTRPVFDVELKPTFVMDTQLCEHKDQFILDVKAKFSPLETNVPSTDTHGDTDYNGMVFTHSEFTDKDINSAFYQKPIWGQADIYKGPIVRTRPSFEVEVKPAFVMDVQLSEQKDEFITDVKATFSPLEDKVSSTGSYSSNLDEGEAFTHTEVTDNMVIDNNESPIEGSVEIGSIDIEFIDSIPNK